MSRLASRAVHSLLSARVHADLCVVNQLHFRPRSALCLHLRFSFNQITHYYSRLPFFFFSLPSLSLISFTFVFLLPPPLHCFLFLFFPSPSFSLACPLVWLSIFSFLFPVFPRRFDMTPAMGLFAAAAVDNIRTTDFNCTSTSTTSNSPAVLANGHAADSDVHAMAQDRAFLNDGRVVRLPKAPVFIAKRGGTTFNAAYTPHALSVATSHTASPCSGYMTSSSTATNTTAATSSSSISQTANTWQSSLFSASSPICTTPATTPPPNPALSRSSSPPTAASHYRTSFVSTDGNDHSLHPLDHQRAAEKDHHGLLLHHYQQSILHTDDRSSPVSNNFQYGSNLPVVAMEHSPHITNTPETTPLLRRASHSQVKKSPRGVYSLHRRHDSTPVYPSAPSSIPSCSPLLPIAASKDAQSESQLETEVEIEAEAVVPLSSSSSLSARYEYDDDFPSIAASESTAPPAQQVAQPLVLPLASALFPHRYNKAARCRRPTLSPPRKRRNGNCATCSTSDATKKGHGSTALRGDGTVDKCGDCNRGETHARNDNEDCDSFKHINGHECDQHGEGRPAKRSSAASMTISERASMGVALLRRRRSRRPPSTRLDKDKNGRTACEHTELVETDSVVAAWRERRTTDAATTDKPSFPRRRNRRPTLPLWCGGRANRNSSTTKRGNGGHESDDGGGVNGAQALGGVAERADELIRTVLDYDDFMHGRHRSKPHNAALRMLSRWRRRV